MGSIFLSQHSHTEPSHFLFSREKYLIIWFPSSFNQAECNTKNESRDLTSDLSKDAGYLGDLETSTNESQNSDSEDGISIMSNEGMPLFIFDHFTITP